jgi:hypothetical protein
VIGFYSDLFTKNVNIFPMLDAHASSLHLNILLFRVRLLLCFIPAIGMELVGVFYTREGHRKVTNDPSILFVSSYYLGIRVLYRLESGMDAQTKPEKLSRKGQTGMTELNRQIWC